MPNIITNGDPCQEGNSGRVAGIEAVVTTVHNVEENFPCDETVEQVELINHNKKQGQKSAHFEAIESSAITTDLFLGQLPCPGKTILVKLDKDLVCAVRC